jgi:hypothetical protein
MGIHRHVVRTVEYDGRLYHLKELPRRYAEREWRFLRFLKDEGVPVVDVVGVVTLRVDAEGDRLDAVLITEHLEFSVPYRLLFLRQAHTRLREPMLDALVHLLVRIHLNGFLWGDCSLSNTLFRRDAGRLAAYVVDTETGELYEELTRGQRQMDVDLAIEKCAGELLDLQAAGVLSADVDPAELGSELEERYHALWAELTRDELFATDERYRIHERLGRINELGYDVEEVELRQDPDAPGADADDAEDLRARAGAAPPDPAAAHGAVVQENQARRLLNDLNGFGAWLQQEEGPLPEAIVAHRWFERIFEPIVALVPQSSAVVVSRPRSSTRCSTTGTTCRSSRGPTPACGTRPRATSTPSCGSNPRSGWSPRSRATPTSRATSRTRWPTPGPSRSRRSAPRSRPRRTAGSPGRPRARSRRVAWHRR